MDDFWDDLENKIGGLVQEAGNRTDNKLASEMSSLTKLTNDQITELFPESKDAASLFELIRLVKEGTSRNEKVDKIVANSEEFAGVIITLISSIT